MRGCTCRETKTLCSSATYWKTKEKPQIVKLFNCDTAKSLQSCPTLSDPMDCSLPDFSVHGIFQARVLEWGAIAFSQFLLAVSEIKRRLLLGRKAMTNLDSILKSRGITLLTKVHLVKALVFPVQFHSVAQSCPTPCDPMNRSMPGLPVHHQLLEFTCLQYCEIPFLPEVHQGSNLGYDRVTHTFKSSHLP